MDDRIGLSQREPNQIEPDEWRGVTFEGELHEKVQKRERRRRTLVVGTVFVVFLLLCAIPVYQNRMPKWRGIQAAAQLSVLLEGIKTRSIQTQKAVRLHVSRTGGTRIDVLDSCEPGAKAIQSESGTWPNAEGQLEVLSVVQAKMMGLEFVSDEVCVDPVQGLMEEKRVLVIVPVNDLAQSESNEEALGRASYVTVIGDSAKISVD